MNVTDSFFQQRPDIKPIIYAYELVDVDSHKGCIKVGETTRSAVERIREQTHTVAVKFRVLGTWSALRDDGTVFHDHDVRAVLLKRGFRQLNEGEDRNEWYRCSLGDVKAAVLGIQAGIENAEERTQNFKLREEQERAIENTLAYYRSAKKDRKGKTPKFLWNAKMRFGKTFAAYKLAERMNAKRVLILTFKPAVSSAWREDLTTHIDFEGWQFVGRGERAGIWYDTIEPQCNKVTRIMQWPWNEPTRPKEKAARANYPATQYRADVPEPDWLEPVANKAAAGGAWTRVAGLGTSGNALALLPVKPGAGEGATAAYSLKGNEKTLVLQFLPDFALWPGLKLGVNVSFDGGKPVYVAVPESDSNIGEKNRLRNKAVQDNFIRVEIPVPQGAKKLEIIATDPGVVIDRVGVRDNAVIN